MASRCLEKMAKYIKEALDVLPAEVLERGTISLNVEPGARLSNTQGVRRY
jgi:hypothetical protein